MNIGTGFAVSLIKQAIKENVMGFGLDANFGHHEKALNVYAERSTILANNLVNADTPGFQAQDLDFKAILENAALAESNNQNAMAATHPGHIQEYSMNNQLSDQLQYRTPMQTSLDGNTVDGEVEKAQFSENSIRYMATLSFLSHEFTKLKMVLGNQ